MSSKIYSAAVIGLDSKLVEVEADISTNPNAVFAVVGLPDTSVQEAKERVRAAIKNSGYREPRTRATINLAPADIQKEGAGYDLPMAVSVMLAARQLQPSWPGQRLFVGELALAGTVRPITGILPIAILVKAEGIDEFYVPQDNALEAKLIPGIKVFPVESLAQLADHLLGYKLIPPLEVKASDYKVEVDFGQFDLSFVRGQEQAKRAMEIAAAGHHNLRLIGPPGSGKTLLAKTLPSILPLMGLQEALEVTRIYSVAGLLPRANPLIRKRPFRHPHHTASAAALVGGGRVPHPGEISLAHRGVLFLDEFSEFPRPVLEALRQPLEDRLITVARTQNTLQFPAHFILIAAQNPCPCGYLNDPDKTCSCSPLAIIRYQKKISGPLLDRIDMHLEVPRVKFEKLISPRDQNENSAAVRARVQEARVKQAERFAGSKNKTLTNSEMTTEEVEQYCALDGDCQNLLRQAVNQLHLSARGYNRILKLSRTIADLAASEKIKTEYIAEALQYRPKEN